ncbi:hypothetical protein Q5752_001962 [Cryptotrichosporon argae]
MSGKGGTDLPAPLRLILALATLASLPPSSSSPSSAAPPPIPAYLSAVLRLLELDPASLPSSASPEPIHASAEAQRGEWTDAEVTRAAGVLVEAALAPDPSARPKPGLAGKVADKLDKDKDKKYKEKHKEKEEAELVRYTPADRATAHRALTLLGLDAATVLSEAERNLSATLFKALRAAEDEADKKVESARAAKSEGWGGSLGRTLATGAGVIAGGVLLGVTGGLAAPAIAAVLAPLGIGSILSASAAPVVLGTLFGVGGGGLAGRRVRERWRGVEEFGFVEVGAGTRATKEEVEDLSEARRTYRERKAKKEATTAKEKLLQEAGAGGAKLVPPAGEEETVAEKVGDLSLADKKAAPVDATDDFDAQAEVDAGRHEIEERLLELTRASGTRASVSLPLGASPPPSGSTTPRASLDAASAGDEKDAKRAKRPPSLTATVVVPGLLSTSRTEAISVWRAICADDEQDTESAHAAQDGTVVVPSARGLKDGRDVYLLRFETATMLKTGQDIDFWVASKIKKYVKKEIIKRTVLSAYFAAVSLPLYVYGMTTMAVDNTWMRATDRAVKAGRLLGEVLEKRVQGERPVVLIGSSVGALTVLHALLYLSTLSPRLQVVESAHLVSLPSAPTADEWARARAVVARRLTNVYTDHDLVLAGVVRLHEVVSRAATGNNGVKVAGLGPVERPGVEDIDVGAVLKGHMELQTKMPEILEIIKIDA